MTWHGRVFRAGVMPTLEILLGRRNTVRLGRAITMEARLDAANDMEHNGELLVQERVLSAMPAGRKVVALDVGANKGEWSDALLSKANDRPIEVHLFEPASATFNELSDHMRREGGRSKVINQALSDKKGSADFYVMGAGLGTNSLHANPNGAESVESVTLNTVDDYCQESGISHIDLMKIDAEGHDMAVLAGASRMLSQGAITALQFEYNQRWIESRHFLKDAFDLMLPLGYKIGKVTARGIEFYPAWHFELESFREANYLACKEESAKVFPTIKWWNLD
jgi:FkbM family methyltransferase